MNHVLRQWWKPWILACLAMNPVHAGDFDAVADRVERTPVLRGTFMQEKAVEGFRNPLRSTGRFIVAADRGVLWETVSPFPSQIVVSQDRIASRQADGSLRVEAEASRQPGLAAINTTFFALISGDFDALEARFEGKVTVRPDGRWQLALTPKPGPLVRALSALHVEGARFVEQVTLDDAQGDHTHIEFADFVVEPHALTEDEAARFD
ncbi:outer membrane lipoprotein carrier protein LolA [Xanthomonadaceae bacterium XH05]|nr:outer membrane lipoprotein carrier protein LolA [Xanthomonadaceae bacterium XH05]